MRLPDSGLQGEPVGKVWSFYAGNWRLRSVGDIRVGDELEAALGIRGSSLQPHLYEPVERSAVLIEWDRYTVVGEVTFCGVNSWVFDFGVPAACALHLPYGHVGALAGEIKLGWMEDRALDCPWGQDLFKPPAPPLPCRWKVERIWLETTPWKWPRPDMVLRDRSGPITFRQIESTAARTDDEGRAEYILDCRLLSLPLRND